jgi:predicted GH43/DUF377 family glycosyl hydrolase
MYDNFAKFVLERGGDVKPLLITANESPGTGYMNPSIMNLNGTLMGIIRHTNYTFYHSERKLFHHPFGPLTYLHPENDHKLRTWNYYVELDSNMEIKRWMNIDTSRFIEQEVWEFVGLEDARIVHWNDRLYTTGVRRDLKPNGEGRMELCEIVVTAKDVVETSRFRIPPPNDPDSYCEKNWMPVLDQPYTYVKWANPTEVVKVDPASQTCTTIFQGEKVIPVNRDIRGGSQVIPYGDGYIALTHEVDLFKSETGRKDAVYKHRFIVWDRDWNMVKYTPDFSIMAGVVEFAVGMCEHNGDYLITYGFQDNASYIMRIPGPVLEEFLNA